MESNQPFGFFRPALIRLSYPTELERAVRLELTILDLQSSALATWRRAQLVRKKRFELSRRVWKTRMFPATSLPRGTRVRATRAFCGGVRTVYNKMEHRTGFEPVSQHWQRRVLNQLDQRCEMVGEDRVELSPRVPRTRMLTLHHTPKLFLDLCSLIFVLSTSGLCGC